MPFERIFLVSVEQSNAVSATRDRQCTQPLMSGVYADCMRADTASRLAGRPERIDWHTLHAAIVVRWPRGLDRIKRMAWAELGGSRAAR